MPAGAVVVAPRTAKRAVQSGAPIASAIGTAQATVAQVEAWRPTVGASACDHLRSLGASA
eukprot:5581222-Pleurochrysis_carterae.AAC.1